MTSFHEPPSLDLGSSNPGPLFDFPPLSPTDFSSDGSDYGSSPFDFEQETSPGTAPWLAPGENPFGTEDFASRFDEQHPPSRLDEQHPPFVGTDSSPCVVNVFGQQAATHPPHEMSPDQIHHATPSPVSPPTSPPPSSPLSPLPTSPTSPSNPSPASPVTPVSLPSSPMSPSPLSPVSNFSPNVYSAPPNYQQQQQHHHQHHHQQPPHQHLQQQQHYQQQPQHHHQQQHQQQPPPPQQPQQPQQTPNQKENTTKERKRKRGNSPTPPNGSPVPQPLPITPPIDGESKILLTQDQLRTMTSEEYAAYVNQLKATHGLSSSDKKEIQRQKRLIRNREYAQKKRRSVKEKTERISQAVETQQNTISTLQDENSYLKSELHRLKSMLALILPPQQHHIIEQPQPVLPLHSNPPSKKRRTTEEGCDSTGGPTSRSPVGQTVLFVFLLCFGVTLSTVFFLPDGVVSSSLRGAGRGLLSESSPLSYPLGKLYDIFYPVIEPIDEGKQTTISTVDSSELKSANLKQEPPKPTHPPPEEEEEGDLSSSSSSKGETFLPGPNSHDYMCDGMLEEVNISNNNNNNSNETLSAAAVEAPEVVD